MKKHKMGAQPASERPRGSAAPQQGEEATPVVISVNTLDNGDLLLGIKIPAGVDKADGLASVAEYLSIVARLTAERYAKGNEKGKEA